MARDKKSLFWISYSDLLTSLFFIILVLFAITFSKYQNKVDDLERKLEVYDNVENTLSRLKNSKVLKYDSVYKRFTLAEDVKFHIGKTDITPTHIMDYHNKVEYLEKVGIELKKTIDNLTEERKNNPKLQKISYVVVISGSASKLKNADMLADYTLSYYRSISLWRFWRSKGINFEADKYKDFIDLQIAGNGWGGIGRIENDEEANQRFIIQIIPKTTDTQ